MTFQLFGRFEVQDASGRLLDVGALKQRAVLALLAVEPGQVVSLDRLIDDLWPGETPASATGSLQAYVSHLRRVIEPDRRPRTPPRVILTRPPGYLLDVPAERVDLSRFTVHADQGRQALRRGDHEQAVTVLDAALALWRGEPLAEFSSLRSLAPTITRLSELRIAAMEDRFDARLSLGDARGCVAELETLVEQHRYRERLWALLVLALYRSGRQADALAALRRIRAYLADDLGIEPGTELRRLEQAVFDQASELDLPTAPPPARVVTAQGADGELIGRDDDLDRLRRRLDRARDGHGGVMLISGEAGVGKTSLARAAVTAGAAHGMTTAWGRCAEEAAPTYWPWRQALSAAGIDTGVLTVREQQRIPDPDAALFELHERVITALGSVGRPVLLVLDDLHWADISSLRLLAFVAGDLGDRPVLIVATFRPEPGSHPELFRDILGAISGEPSTDRIDLSAFGADEVAAYLRLRHAPDDRDLVRTLLERSGGNPFYLGELLRLRDSEQQEGVPAGARDVIDRRISRLPRQTRELMRTGSVIGRDLDVELLAAVADRPTPEVMAALEPAVATGMLHEPPHGHDYRFAHTLVRDTLYWGMSRLERARTHLAVGTCLEWRPGVDPVELAHHFAAAAKVGAAAKAVHYASRAAREATTQLAFTEAVQHWETALGALGPDDDADRCTLLTELGQARRDLGDAAGAVRDLDSAITLAQRTGNRAALVPAISVFGGPAVWNWRPYGTVDDDIVELLEELLAGHLDDTDRAALQGTLGVELHYSDRRAEGERHAADAVDLARRLGDPELRARTLNNYLLASWVPGRNTERLRAADEMLSIPGLPRATRLVARVLRMACLLRAGDLAEWDRDLERCERLLQRGSRPELEAMVRIAETARRTLDGHWAEAEDLLARYGRVRYGSTPWGLDFHRLVTLYTCRRGQGRVADIAEELTTAAARPDLTSLRPLAILAAVDLGDDNQARRLVRRWGSRIAKDWTADFLIPVWGLVAARLGEPDPKHLYLTLLGTPDLLVIGGMGSSGLGSTRHVLADLAQRLGRPDDARRHARAGLETHHRLGLAHWEEHSRRQLAQLGAPRPGG
nr:AfsR/SARP family transcriptional regulator [Jiangella mangrovi]